jgi:NAD(P)-dependent dehydrogenase (short-subunit alcohol dehydrogenase family)
VSCSKGVVLKYLEAGATVAVVSRTADKVAELKKAIQAQGVSAEKLLSVVGSFHDEHASKSVFDATLSALGGKINHVVSNLGFALITATSATASKLSDLKHAFDDGLFNTFLAAQVFLPAIKDVPKASYTITSGGFAHACYFPGGMLQSLDC